MYFFDKKHQKKQAQKRLAFYVMSSVILTALTIVLTLITLGYWLDRESGELVRNSLVLVAGKPKDANISVDGKDIDAKMSARLSLPAGVHNLKISKAGYTTWQKNIKVKGSNILDLSYIRLMPETFVPALVDKSNFNSTNLLVSDDRKLAVMVLLASTARRSRPFLSAVAK